MPTINHPIIYTLPKSTFLKCSHMKSRQITIKDAEYPSLLKEISSPPQRLWLTGSKLVEGEKRLTVVGTRKPTPYGRRVVHKLIKEIAEAGVTIVSGLAIGIDGLAHQAALDAGGKTIAILAGGLDIIYPASHRGLADKIIKSGGTLISEYPPGSEHFKQNFVARNRIQSGVSESVLIVESTEKSGTLITAQFALDQNRNVMAIPGNIDSLTSKGTNNLIRDGAIPVTCAQDILDVLGINRKAANIKAYTPENKVEEKILECIRNGIHSSEEIQLKSDLEVVEYTTNLTMLEIRGVIHQVNPGYWDLS